MIGNYQEAVQLFEKALYIDADHVGEALKHLGKTVEAQVYHDKALQLDPTYTGGPFNKLTKLVTESSAI